MAVGDTHYQFYREKTGPCRLLPWTRRWEWRNLVDNNNQEKLLALGSKHETSVHDTVSHFVRRYRLWFHSPQIQGWATEAPTEET